MWRAERALFVLLGLVAGLMLPLFVILLVPQLAALGALAAQMLEGEAPRSQQTQAGQHKNEKSASQEKSSSQEYHKNQTSICPSSMLTSGCDEPDRPATIQRTSEILTALGKVLDCAYNQFVFGWCDVPEDMYGQPLYQVLQKELFEAVEEIKEKTAHVNCAETMVGVVNKLTLHLHECKKKDKPRQEEFKTKDDEAAFYRKYSEEILSYLLPAALSVTQLTKRFLIEIFTFLVLKPTVDTLADPDFLNQMLIQQIGQPETRQLTNNLPERDNMQVAVESLFAPQEEQAQANTENGDSGNAVSKFKKTFKKAFKFGRNKSQKRSKRKQNASDVEFRLLETDGGNDGSTDDDVSEEDNDCFLEADGSALKESSDMEIDINGSALWSSLNKILWEEWNRGNWKATVSKLEILNDELNSCTIRVEDTDCPEESYWEFKRDLRMFILLKETLIQDFPDLDDVNIESVLGRQYEEDNTFQERAEFVLNNFLERLVQIVTTSQNSEAFYFLFPVELSDEDDDLPSESEEVESSEEFEADGLGGDSLISESLPDDLHTLTYRVLPERQATSLRNKIVQLRHDDHEDSTEKPATQETSNETLRKAFITLIAEIINIPGSRFLTRLLLKRFLDDLPNQVNELCSESQLASYIDSLREVLWPNGEPALPTAMRTLQEKHETSEKAKKLLLNICTTKIFQLFWRAKGITIFNIFQQADQNKILFYRCLLFLLDEVILRKEQPRDIDGIRSLT